jgi:uncharacterized C2H2 Zn-finger protein
MCLVKMSFQSKKKSNIFEVKCNKCDHILALDTLRSHVNDCPAKSVGEDKQKVDGKKDEEKVLPCKWCSFVSRTRQARETHLYRAHPWVFRHRCKVCPAKYQLGAQLLRHVECAHFIIYRSLIPLLAIALK